jgi:uncharacterized protein involved in tolerance to divalent cations
MSDRQNGNNLADNEYVKELFAILEENKRDTSGLSALLDHVKEMEQFIKTAESSINDMKHEISEMKASKENPIRTALKNAISALEKNISAMKEKLGELKEGIADGCKKAVTAVKEKGITALAGLSSFFSVKGTLENHRELSEANIKTADKHIARIEAISTEYHKTGSAIRNTMRAIVGRESQNDVKGQGALAKGIIASIKVNRAVSSATLKAVNKTVAAVERLDDAANTIKEKSDKKKSGLMDKLTAIKEESAGNATKDREKEISHREKPVRAAEIAR